MTPATGKKYNVGGIALDRPFKIRRLGHFGFNASELEASRRFYFDLLGFFVTEPAGAGGGGSHFGLCLRPDGHCLQHNCLAPRF